MQSTRSRPVKLFQSASTEESVEATTSDTRTVPTTSKQPKQRWSVLFGLKNPQQNQLCEILNNYTKNGVPQLKSSSFSFDHADLPSALDYLENIHSTWKDFVCYSNMTDNEIKIQSAIWELVTTEVDYIHALQTVTDVSIIHCTLCIYELLHIYIIVYMFEIPYANKLVKFKMLTFLLQMIRLLAIHNVSPLPLIFDTHKKKRRKREWQ